MVPPHQPRRLLRCSPTVEVHVDAVPYAPEVGPTMSTNDGTKKFSMGMVLGLVAGMILYRILFG